jgi:catechol 2,3-dioxygenase-like lactoylglutathione lyase family enzyme
MDEAMKLDHLLVMTDDLAGTEAFFRDLGNLTVGVRPPFPFPGSWLYADGQAVVHLAEARTSGASNYLRPADGASSTYIDHVAFTGGDHAAFLERLAKTGMEHFERQVPETGERQIFVTGPGGLKLEFIFR